MKMKTLLVIIILLSCFTYAGTLDIGMRLYPAEFLCALVIIPIFFLHGQFPVLQSDLRLIALTLAFFGLLALNVFLVALGVIGVDPSLAIKEFVRSCASILAFPAILYYLRTQGARLELFEKSFVASAMFVSLYALYQWLSVKVTGHYVSLIPGSSNVPNVNGRGVGTFYEGGYAALFIGAGFLLTLRLRSRGHLTQTTFIAASATQLSALLSTQSTAGIGAMGVVLIIILCSRFKAAIYAIGGLSLVLALWGGFAVNDLRQEVHLKKLAEFAEANAELSTQTATTAAQAPKLGLVLSAADRASKILNGINMFRHSPIFGVGLSQYGVLLSRYPPPEFYPAKPDAVPLNVYVEIAAETGIVALCLFLWLYADVFMRADHWYRLIIIFTLINFMAYPSYKMIYLWILVAMAAVSRSESALEARATQNDRDGLLGLPHPSP